MTVKFIHHFFTSFKMKLLVTKYLITATALIVVVATIPVLSSVVWAQQSTKGSIINAIRVVVINKPDCWVGKIFHIHSYCPAGMKTTVKIGSTFTSVVEARACEDDPTLCYGMEGIWPISHNVPFEIDAKEGAPPPDHGGPDPMEVINWNFLPPHIIATSERTTVGDCGDKTGTSAGTSCKATWPNYNGTITFDVNYAWEQCGVNYPKSDIQVACKK
jgi:hypothetical protein